ncbi:MAG: carbohydrate ABC transporter permease [Verrucomicrobia bacterium]|nr:MAG: carbohydrate ABC transporter permease [Verrucomicrobiota bacterium]
MRRRSGRISRGLVYGVLLAYLAWTVLPMLWVAASALKTDAAIFRDPLGLPAVDALQWDNFARAWTGARFGDYFLSSVVVTVVSVAGILLLGSMAAYALSRFFHPLGRVVYGLFLAGLMIPVQLSIVPLFFELRALGLLNSLAGLILVYVANGLPFAIFILAGFFRGLPRALYEAAVIDGCSEARAFWHVMLPLARPGLVTVAIFQFIGIWKEYFYAFMFLSGGGPEAPRTLPLALANLAIASQYETDFGMLFAGLVIVTLPLLVFYLVVQKHLIRGITTGAVKG